MEKVFRSPKYYTCKSANLKHIIRMFLTQALAVNGFPFEIKRANPNPYGALTEHEILDKLEKLREHVAQGCIKMQQKFLVI